MNPEKDKNDVAALASAAVAGSVSILVGSGPFSFVSSSIGLSLMVIVLVYSWQSIFKKEQRVAFSVVFALLVMIFFAPILELFHFHFMHKYTLLKSFTLFSSGKESLVNGNVLFLSWLISSFLIYFTLTLTVGLNGLENNEQEERSLLKYFQMNWFLGLILGVLITLVFMIPPTWI
ncbi:hypothetical protein [Aliivibrio fischeri]|uniref:hypothetical protein n=1 Tax=Aliivibrio fischeri TaxID=668 RepID=UPI0012DAF5C1|nr:hypothetical protein [Aliivibrio fischeri]MUJ39712.1 hypothetical protein [Aliivibrio fischeri]